LPKLLVIIGGPTASGKSDFAINLALHYKTAIISADSRQFFKELSIGTAKPSEAELKQVPHFFINSHNLSDTVNAAAYGTEVRSLLSKLFVDKDVVIMAGGSGLYIDAVLNTIDELPEVQPEIRTSLNGILEQQGLPALFQLLQEKDPASAAKIDRHNPRRIIRALEVTMSTGVPYSSLLGKTKLDLPFECLFAGIDWPRESLYQRIDQRTQQMMTSGLLEEVKAVSNYRHCQALQTVGYRELFQFFDGEITLEQAVALIAQHTRNYAKRQLTWFRKYEDLVWLKPGSEMSLTEIIDSRLKQ
jgi:tRNA dimethylallyltransferase